MRLRWTLAITNARMLREAELGHWAAYQVLARLRRDLITHINALTTGA